jgi:hypothetical protein
MAEIAPELVDKDKVFYPHEASPYISTEPHFRRMWQHYREHSLRVRFAYLVQEGAITEEDANAFKDFVNLTKIPSVSLYLLGKVHNKGLKNHPGF